MRPKVDEVVRRSGRVDPRREASDPPPPPPSAEHDTIPPRDDAERARALDGVAEDLPPLPTAPAAREEPISTREEPRAPTHHAVTSVDPRLEAIEPAIAAGDWAEVARHLGTDEGAGRLPPNLGVLYALARKESEHDEAKAARSASAYNALAIRCMAGLFGVPEESPIALVLAKRLLRKNPVAWQRRPAPPAKVSVILIVLAIVIGGGVGWALSMGYVRFHFR